MISKIDIARRFGQNASTYEEAATAQYEAARRLVSMMGEECDTGGRVFEVGCGTGTLTRMLMKTLKPHSYIANDISEGMLDRLVDTTSDNIMAVLPGDAEQIDWPGDVDVVVSSSAVQWFDNPLSFVGKAAVSLVSGGVMGVVTYGPRTFVELQTLGVPGLAYPTLDEWQRAVDESGLEIAVSENRQIVLEYPTAIDVMKELQRAGVTASERPLTAGSMRSLMKRYDTQFRTETGMVGLTYDIYTIVARKR